MSRPHFQISTVLLDFYYGKQATQCGFSPKNKIPCRHVTKLETKAFLCDQLKVIPNVSQLVLLLSNRGHGNNNAALWHDSGIRQIPDPESSDKNHKLSEMPEWCRLILSQSDQIIQLQEQTGAISFHGPAEDTCASASVDGGRQMGQSLITSESVYIIGPSLNMKTRKDLSPVLLLFDP